VRVTAVIQARLGSTRCPRKMVALVAGRPLVEHVIRRALRLTVPGEVVLATPDPLLAAIAQDLGVRAHLGPEVDVLGRILGALEGEAALVVRICGDSLLWPVDEVDHAAASAVATGADLVVYDAPSPIPGVDIVSERALRLTRALAPPGDPEAYEHVTAYAVRHWEALGLRVLTRSAAGHASPGGVIDTPEDLERWRGDIEASCE